MPKKAEINDEKLNKIEMYSKLLITQEKELQLAESKLVKTLKILQNHVWYPQQESNLHLPLRRGLFYPLNYEDKKNCLSKISNFL